MIQKLFSITFLLFTLSCVAQQKEYTSSVPKAVRAFDEGLNFYNSRMYQKALGEFDNAIKADSNFVEAYMLKANVYADLKNYTEAIRYYNLAILLKPEFFPNNYYSLAKVEQASGKYGDAKGHFETFLTFPKINKTLKGRAEAGLQNCAFAEQAVKLPIPFQPINMGDSINSPGGEYFPTITADGKTFLFTRRFNKQDEYGKMLDQEDFFISHLTPKGWSKALPLDELNTNGNEGASSLSPDGQYLFFTSCEEMLIKTRATKGSCDLFLAKRINDKFVKPRNLEVPINTGSWESQPSFSSDGRTLYFIRRIKEADGNTHTDILVTSIGDNSQWTEPVSVSDKINTKSNESAPFIHPDNQTLYFCSDGHPGMGGLDIFMSRKQIDGSWGEPINLGYPINSIDDESSLLVSPDGKLAYISSDRSGGFGKEDLYQFELYDKVRPQPITYMKGKVFDSETKIPLLALFELIDLETKKTIVSSISNSGNGEFLVCLPAGRRYALNVSKDGYLFYSDNFELKEQQSTKEPFLKDVPLNPIKAGKSIVLKNIFFETDKYELKEESMVELKKLITFLTKNPKVKFEISGHTDNVGGKAYNQNLSERRAKSVYDYLVANGVAASRITSAGYGDTKPVAENTTAFGRAQNRRTEFTIVSVE